MIVSSVHCRITNTNSAISLSSTVTVTSRPAVINNRQKRSTDNLLSRQRRSTDYLLSRPRRSVDSTGEFDQPYSMRAHVGGKSTMTIEKGSPIIMEIR